MGGSFYSKHVGTPTKIRRMVISIFLWIFSPFGEKSGGWIRLPPRNGRCLVHRLAATEGLSGLIICFNLLVTVCDSDGTGNNRNKVPDVSSLDLYGNAVSCTCADGFIVEEATCSAGALQSGACSGTQQRNF